MSSEMTLDSWNEKFGNDETDYTESTRKSNFFEMALEVMYPVEVTTGKVTKSKIGDVQLELDLDVANGVAKNKTWLTLPKQESDLNLKLDKDSVRKITLRRRDDLIRVMSKAIPATFALYAEKTGEGKSAKYFDHDGNEIEDLNKREQQINKAAMDYADELHGRVGETIDELAGTEFFIVKVENPKNEKYPFVNYYSYAPKKAGKYPLFGTGEDVPF